MKMTHEAVISVISLFIFITGTSGQGSDYYCTTNTVQQISGNTSGNIYTLRQGQGHYQNDEDCAWVIDAGPDHRLEITVQSSDLQWAPQSAICPGYDHVAIKDGNNGGTESIILQWCGRSKPLGALSTGRYVRVEFMSDKNNPYQYTGVHLHFRTFSASDCAPSWNASSDGFCYKVLDKATDWSSAQKECNTDRANLASITSESEHNFLLQTYGSLTSPVWIGLSDIAEPGDYEWIDQNQLTVNKFGAGHAASQYHRCAVLRFSEQDWQVKDCKDPTKPLCKSHRGSKTDLFPIPQQKPDEGDTGFSPLRVVLIVVSIVVVFILIIVFIFIYRRRQAKKRQSSYDRSKRYAASSEEGNHGGVTMSDRSRETRPTPRQATAPPEEGIMINPDPQMVAPPAYDEAMSHPVIQSSFN